MFKQFVWVCAVCFFYSQILFKTDVAKFFRFRFFILANESQKLHGSETFNGAKWQCKHVYIYFWIYIKIWWMHSVNVLSLKRDHLWSNIFFLKCRFAYLMTFNHINPSYRTPVHIVYTVHTFQSLLKVSTMPTSMWLATMDTFQIHSCT